MTDPTVELHEVRLLDVPVPIYRLAQAHNDALQREFDLIRQTESAESAGSSLDSVPARLHQLIGELEAEFGGVSREPAEELAAAVEQGLPSMDLTYRLPAAASVASRRLDQLLDEAEAYCRGGSHLLTLVAPPDALRFRRWFLAEFTRQLDEHLEPLPWSRYEGGETAESASSADEVLSSPTEVSLPDGWGVSRSDGGVRLTVMGALDMATAPMLREALQRLREAGATTVEVDATEAHFVDSVAISVIVATHLRLEEEDVRLVIHPSEELRRTLALTKLEDHLHLV